MFPGSVAARHLGLPAIAYLILAYPEAVSDPATAAPEPFPAGSRLPSHYDHCYGCGSHIGAGLHMELWVGPDRTVLAEFDVTPDHQGAPGLIHGGVLAAAFDEVLGALSWLLQTPAVTARLETDFRRPVPVGVRVFITAEVESQNGRKTWRRATARLADGTELASASGLFLEVPPDHFRRHGGGSQSWEAAAERNET